MKFKMVLELEVDKDNFSKINEDTDIYEIVDGKVEFIIDNKTFLSNFIPVEDSEEFHSDLKNDYEVPIISYLFDLSNLYFERDSYKEFKVTADFFAHEYLFINDGMNTHIFLRSKFEDLIYNGEKTFYSMNVPEKSNFVIPNDVFFDEIRSSMIRFKESVKLKYPKLANNSYFKGSF